MVLSPHSEFRRVLASEMVSNFGSMLSRLAIPWIATLVLHATPLEMGLLLVADVIAGAAGSLLLGAVVDRRDKRSVMLGADFARAAVLGLLAMLAAAQWLSFWMLFVAAGASGLFTAMFELARSAWIAQRTEAPDLPARNAQLSVGASLSETAAFALGGWLYLGLGAALALLVDAVSYLVSAILLRGVTPTREMAPQALSARERVRSLFSEARTGLSVLASSPRLVTLASTEALLALGVSLMGTSYMIFVARDLGFDTATLGMIFAMGGIGSLLGASLAPRIARRIGAAATMVLGLALLVLGTLCIPLAAGATLVGVLLLVAHQVIGDGGRTLFDIHDRTLRQTSASPELLARVDAGIRTLGYLATLIGAIGGGAIATVLGARQAIWISVALFAAATAVLLLRLRRLR